MSARTITYRGTIKVSSEDLSAALAGNKTCTIRKGLAAISHSELDLTDGHRTVGIVVTRIDQSKRFGDLGMEEVRGEGFQNVEQLRADLRQYYRALGNDSPVTVIWFSLRATAWQFSYS